MNDDDLDALIASDTTGLLDPESKLTPELVADLKAKMVSPDEDPSLSRKATATPADLMELSFEIYDRKAHVHRVISRAFTLAGRLILAKVALDALAGVETPVTARELHDYRSHGAPRDTATLAAWGCAYGKIHDPRSQQFLYGMNRCMARSYAGDPAWVTEHVPWVEMQLDYYGRHSMVVVIPPHLIGHVPDQEG